MWIGIEEIKSKTYESMTEKFDFIEFWLLRKKNPCIVKKKNINPTLPTIFSVYEKVGVSTLLLKSKSLRIVILFDRKIEKCSIFREGNINPRRFDNFPV